MYLLRPVHVRYSLSNSSFLENIILVLDGYIKEFRCPQTGQENRKSVFRCTDQHLTQVGERYTDYLEKDQRWT